MLEHPALDSSQREQIAREQTELSLLSKAQLDPAPLRRTTQAELAAMFSSAAIAREWPAVATVSAVVLLLGVIFAGMLMQALRVSYGAPSGGRVGAHGVKDAARFDWRAERTTLLALAPLAIAMVLFGVHVPGGVEDLLEDVSVVLGPVAQ